MADGGSVNGAICEAVVSMYAVGKAYRRSPTGTPPGGEDLDSDGLIGQTLIYY